MCAEIKEIGLESAENHGDCFEVAHALSSEDFQGSDHQTTSLSELESQTTKATGETSVSSDRNKQPIGPKSPYQSHPKPKNTFVVDEPRQPKLLKFPVCNPESKKTKCFHVSWYQKFHWLDYDVEKDASHFLLLLYKIFFRHNCFFNVHSDRVYQLGECPRQQ